MQNSVERYYIQIGTVMTDPDYLKQRLAAKLMKHVIEVYEEDCDVVFWFGDLRAADFNWKIGFLL